MSDTLSTKFGGPATRYLITHDRCACRVQLAAGLETPKEVACWFWGRNVLDHIVYEGECPYHFSCGDIESITAVLTLYKASWVRYALPLYIPLRALHHQGYCRWRHDSETVVCVIGDSDMGDLRHRGMCCHLVPGHGDMVIVAAAV